jgi:hypothetical protein
MMSLSDRRLIAWAAAGVIASIGAAQASAQEVGSPAIMTMKKASPWAKAPTAAELKAVEPPGDGPAALRVECRADKAGGLNGCGFVDVYGGEAATQAGTSLLPKFRLARSDAKALPAEGAYVVFYIAWRSPNHCRPPACIGVVPPAPPPEPGS